MFLEHINLTVSDLNRSIDFYSRVFGFTVRWQGQSNNGKPAAHVGDDRCYLALFLARDTTPHQRKSYDSIGLNHFGFVVEDIDAIKRRLSEAGITHHSEQTYDPGRHVYFLDPDGIEVELVQYAEHENPAPDRVAHPEPVAAASTADRGSRSSQSALARIFTSLPMGLGFISPQVPDGRYVIYK